MPVVEATALRALLVGGVARGLGSLPAGNVSKPLSIMRKQCLPFSLNPRALSLGFHLVAPGNGYADAALVPAVEEQEPLVVAVAE